MKKVIESNYEKAKSIADQCRPCSKYFYSGILQGVKIALDVKDQEKKDFAVGFADWLFLWKRNALGEWKHQNSNKIIKTTTELIELYQKHLENER